MKKILALAFLLLASQAFGWKAHFDVTASGGAPIPAAYSTSDTQSQVLTGIPANEARNTTLCVANQTGTIMHLNTMAWSSTPSGDTHSIPPFGTLCTYGISSSVYLRGDSSSTAGRVFGWAE